MPRRTKEDAEVTRLALLDAAELVFYRKGVSQASLNEIACEAGMSRGAVYWHFKDKKDLFLALIDRAMLPLEKVAYAEMQCTEKGAKDSVRALLQRVLSAIQQDTTLTRTFQILVSRVEFVGELEAVQQRMLGSAQRFDCKVQQLLEEEFSIDSPHSQQAACAIGCLIDGLLRKWLNQDRGFELCAVGMRALDSYLEGWQQLLETEALKAKKVVRQ